jgi:hypothetical protein
MSSGNCKVLYVTAVIAVLALALVVSGCSGGSSAGDKNGDSSAPTAAVHGTISVGTAVKETTMGITSAGGKVTVNNPSSPINGLTIDIPSGAYASPRTFTVSSAPVTGNTFGKYFNVASPLITIDNGGGYADDFVTVRIPVNASPSDFVMAFIYDDANKSLEGLYTVDRDASSITVATLHFSDIEVLKINQMELDAIKVVDTGFLPGRDDWEFPNNGSYIAPDGHCAGQTVSMMWYFTEKRQKENAPKLNGLYDNNGREKTLQIYGDDVLAYRLASVVQDNIRFDFYNQKFGNIVRNETPLTNFNCFKYSMLMSGEPQYVRLRNSEGGHAIVGYAIDGDTLFVSDPNYPGKVRTIKLTGNVLGPYNTGKNAEAIAANGETVYPNIYYAGKTSMIPVYALPGLWNQFKAGTIGDGQFPAIRLFLNFTGANNANHMEKLLGGNNSEVFHIKTNLSNVKIATSDLAFYLFMGNDRIYPNSVQLQQGKNMLGVTCFLKVNNDWAWVGFMWVEIDYQPDAATPTPGNERKPDRAARTVTLPAAPAPIQMKVINNTDGSSQVYAYYKDSNGGDITWGSLKTFYPGGKLKSESSRFFSKTIGYSRSYESTGVLIYEQYRDSDGVLAYQDYYASNGKLRLAVDYWPGEKEKDRYDYGDYGGSLQNYYEYDQAGSLKLKEVWNNGRLVSSTPQ